MLRVRNNYWLSMDFEKCWFAFQTQFKLNARTTRAVRGLVVQMRELGFKFWLHLVFFSSSTYML